LIRHLMSAPVQADFAIQAGMLPSRADTLSQPPFSDANFQMLQRALHAGHSFPSVSMWGLIEDKLGQALIQIWRDIFSQSNPEIDTIIGHYLDPLTQRLEQLLLNQI
jgi:ABC-type glycerol-3-phosphate transport system substrate-binding protein